MPGWTAAVGANGYFFHSFSAMRQQPARLTGIGPAATVSGRIPPHRENGVNRRRAWICVVPFTLTSVNDADCVALSTAARPISAEFVDNVGPSHSFRNLRT